ncbi:MAG: glycosyltransferase [Actinobacteria bacterium]|nr:glycosyltransferase [Actinomycetota bacterium]
MKALIIIPTHDHASLLPLAVRSAQEQTEADVGIAIIGDGVGDDTRSAVAPLLADPRISFLDLPKAGRTGEVHRHRVLADENLAADFITYLGDDDLLLPDHVEVMGETLARCDVAHSTQTYVDEHGVCHYDAMDLGDPEWAQMEFVDSLVSLTGLSHTLAAYRRLPYGWRSTPPGVYTDQYMVQQFLAQPWCRMGCAGVVTVLRFPSSMRPSMTAEQRYDEMSTWADRLATDEGRNSFRATMEQTILREASVIRRRAINFERRVIQLTTDLSTSSDALTSITDTLASATTAHRSEVEQLTRQVAEFETELSAMSVAYRQLRSTRALRLRDALVKNRLLRALLARKS